MTRLCVRLLLILSDFKIAVLSTFDIDFFESHVTVQGYKNAYLPSDFKMGTEICLGNTEFKHEQYLTNTSTSFTMFELIP